MADQIKSNDIECGILDVQCKLKGLSALLESCGGPINGEQLSGLSIMIGGFADELDSICHKFLKYSGELEYAG